LGLIARCGAHERSRHGDPALALPFQGNRHEQERFVVTNEFKPAASIDFAAKLPHQVPIRLPRNLWNPDRTASWPLKDGELDVEYSLEMLRQPEPGCRISVRQGDGTQ